MVDQPLVPARDTPKAGPSSWIEMARDRVLVAAFVLVILVSATQIKTFPPSAAQYSAQFGDGNLLRQSLYSLCVLGVLFATRPLERPLAVVAIPPTVLLLLLFCAASVLWSASPSVASRRLTLTIMVLWVAFRAVNALQYRRALDILTVTLAALLFINYAYVALDPGAIHQFSEDGGLAGDWHGLIPHKNDAGPITAITIVLLTFGYGRMRPSFRWVMVAMAAYFLWRTHSKTSIGLVFVTLLTGAAFLRYNPAYRAFLLPVVLAIGAGLVLAASIYVPGIRATLETSEDAFTGRIQIWRTMVLFIGDNFWLGAGFGSFWDAGSVSPANVYGRGWVSSMVSQGHNGYLDLWTQIGIFGLALAVTVMILIPAAKLFVYKGGGSRGVTALLLALLVFLAAHNFTETTMLARDYFGNLMLGIVIACINGVTRTRERSMPLRQPMRLPAGVRSGTPVL